MTQLQSERLGLDQGSDRFFFSVYLDDVGWYSVYESLTISFVSSFCYWDFVEIFVDFGSGNWLKKSWIQRCNLVFMSPVQNSLVGF